MRTLANITEELLPSGKIRYRIDFGRVKGAGRVRIDRSADGIRFESREHAQVILERVEHRIVELSKQGKTLAQILIPYLPASAKPNLVDTHLAAWISVKKRETEAGDLSPTYLRELVRWSGPRGWFSWWYGMSIHEITSPNLSDFSLFLGDQMQLDRRSRPTEKRLGATTRRKILGGLASFIGWLVEREDLERRPRVPRVPADEYSPRILTARAQDLVLEEIADADRGPFLVMGLMGLRPNEARALNVEDYRDGWLTVGHAMKGTTHTAPRRGTKTRKARYLPCPAEIAALIESTWPSEHRIANYGKPMFVNARARKGDGRWTWSTLDHAWKAACAGVGVQVRMYEGTKHTFASDAGRRGVPERSIQAYLGHSDIRSTRRYNVFREEALVDVLRARGPRAAHGPVEGAQLREIVSAIGGADGTRTRNFRRDRPVL